MSKIYNNKFKNTANNTLHFTLTHKIVNFTFYTSKQRIRQTEFFK